MIAVSVMKPPQVEHTEYFDDIAYIQTLSRCAESTQRDSQALMVDRIQLFQTDRRADPYTVHP